MSKQTIARVALGVMVLLSAVGILLVQSRRADASQFAPAVASPPDASTAETPEPAALAASLAPAPPASHSTTTADAPSPAVVVARTTGNLLSANQATLAFGSSGRIQDVRVKEGDRVKAGDVIATLDTAALDAQVVQAQAALDSALANLAKTKAGPTVDDTIVAKGNIDRAKAALDQAQSAYDKIGGASNPSIAMSQQALTLQQAYSNYQTALSTYNLTINHPTDAELKTAQAAVAQAQAALEIAKLNAANARITVPFDGTVVSSNAHIGESAVSGAGEIVIADLPRMQVQVNADQMVTGNIKVGQTVSITLDALPGKTLTGRVARVGLLASTSGNIVSTPITIDVSPSEAAIYPGLSATVQFLGGNP